MVYALGGALGVGGLGTAVTGTLGGIDDETRPKALVAGSLLHVAEETSGASVEAHGSAAVRQLIRDGLRDPDAVALADPRLFAGISDRATVFATNALVLTYDPDSDHAGAIRRDWTAAVERDGVRLGRTDPSLDPLGYRTVMALRLAAETGAVDARSVLDRASIFQETDLLNVVEGGGIDAAFAYRNMAVERDLPFVSLPDRIDFSNPDRSETYRSVSYDLDGRTLRGAPIRYAARGLTESGRRWIERLVTAMDRLERFGFVVPSSYPRRNARLEFDVGR